MALTASQARELIEKYTEGWVRGDERAICAPLSESCLVIESHGPTYRGIPEIRQWIGDWTRSNSVDSWVIKSFVFTNDTACFEWHFKCTCVGTSDQIYGASFVRFTNQKISSICEYKITVLPDNWKELFGDERV
jgi:hypothetical protein